jgi:sortase B
MKRFLYRLAVTALVFLMLLGACNIYAIDGKYRQEKKTHDMLLAYKPTVEEKSNEKSVSNWTDVEEQEAAPNKSIQEAKASLNKDVVGWISIPGTGIDYPFLQGPDNQYYLSRDPQKKDSKAGSIFLDARADPEFKGFNAIIYGHHMKNGSMFGELANYSIKDYFEKHPQANLTLEYKSFALDIFACLVIRADNKYIYGTLNPTPEERQKYFEYVKANAKAYRDIDIKDNDRIVTMSTCSYDFEDARMVVLGRIKAS